MTCVPGTVKSNRCSRHNDVPKLARMRRNSWSSRQACGQGRSRDLIIFAAAALVRPLLSAITTFTTPLRPNCYIATHLHFDHCIAHRIAHQHQVKATRTASFPSRIPHPSFSLITSLLGNICFRKHLPTHRLPHHTSHATNIHAGAHQDDQKIFVRNAS